MCWSLMLQHIRLIQSMKVLKVLSMSFSVLWLIGLSLCCTLHTLLKHKTISTLLIVQRILPFLPFTCPPFACIVFVCVSTIAALRSMH